MITNCLIEKKQQWNYLELDSLNSSKYSTYSKPNEKLIPSAIIEIISDANTTTQPQPPSGITMWLSDSLLMLSSSGLLLFRSGNMFKEPILCLGIRVILCTEEVSWPLEWWRLVDGAVSVGGSYNIKTRFKYGNSSRVTQKHTLMLKLVSDRVKFSSDQLATGANFGFRLLRIFLESITSCNNYR